MIVWRRMVSTLALLTLILTLTPAADAADRPGAAAFLRRVYAPYLAGDTRTAPTGASAAGIFDRSLVALIRRDTAAAHGEVGVLDSDPICACQDFDHLTALRIAVVSRGANRTTATVSFVNGTTPVKLRYALAATRAGWRVADIGSAATPSLVALLKHGQR